MPSKPVVLVLGATGSTGQSVVRGLLASNNFVVKAMIRPASASKPTAQNLREDGVDVLLADLTDGVAKLKSVLYGVDIVISATSAWSLHEQKDVIQPAKETGVKRFVPCDFCTPGARGVRFLHDSKLEIHDLIESLGLPHTYIDVGWWMQTMLPLPSRSAVPAQFAAITNTVYADGGKPILTTDNRNIGAWVARIVADPRTLNHSVIVWEDEKTLNETIALAENVAGPEEAAKMRASRGKMPEAMLRKMHAEGHVSIAAATSPADPSLVQKVSFADYMVTLHVIGENSLDNAKRLGYLDAQELYPDAPRHTLGEFAKEFYAMDEPGEFMLVAMSRGNA